MAPFTAHGKLKAVANGVPLAMGRAITTGVKLYLEEQRNVESIEYGSRLARVAPIPHEIGYS